MKALRSIGTSLGFVRQVEKKRKHLTEKAERCCGLLEF